jgi:hypothetical protein
VINFLGEDISLNLIEQYGSVQVESIAGNDAIKNFNIVGENGLVVREIDNTTTSKKFTETITDTKYQIEVDTILLKAQIQGFFNSTGVTQPLVPLGSSTNDVISALQSLGLFRED